MNKANFITTGGYPLKAERLQELETAYRIFNSLGALAGNLTIISGCETIGTTVKDGFVYINGELLEFKAASVTGTSKVMIIEQAINRPFKNGVIKQVYTIRYATFGTAETSWAWSDFKRPAPTKTIPEDLLTRLEALEKKSAVFQAGGGMVLWNKPVADIPQGWQEVVNWRGRMPVGWDTSQTEFNALGKTGGSKTKKLSLSELPKFTVTGTAAGPYTGTNIGGGFKGGDNAFKQRPFTANSVGGDGTFSIMNPYRVVIFIEYIG